MKRQMPTIIDTRPISITIGPVQMDGYLFIADPPEGSFIEGRVSVLGMIEVQIVARMDGSATVDITLPDGPATFTISFNSPRNSFLAQVQPKGSRKVEEWHLLASLSRRT